MPSKSKLTVCLDANVIISAIAFGGIPLELLEQLYDRNFYHVTGPNILTEVHRNLITKLDQPEEKVDLFLHRITEVSTVYVPSGRLRTIAHQADNLVLELAIIGNCDVLVTGDKKHLLPLNPFHGITIEPPSHFLKRLSSSRS